MRGRLRDRVPDVPTPSVPSLSLSISGRNQARLVLSAVVFLMAASLGGVLSGLGLFIMALVSMKALMLSGSAMLFSFSLASLTGCYLWLTA
jgi:hypothetical protein